MKPNQIITGIAQLICLAGIVTCLILEKTGTAVIILILLLCIKVDDE